MALLKVESHATLLGSQTAMEAGSPIDSMGEPLAILANSL